MLRAALLFLLSLSLQAGFAEEVTGEKLMEAVRARLPQEAIRLRGFIRTRNGRRDVDRGLISELRFGDAEPNIRYEVMDAFGQILARARIAWPGGRVDFRLDQENGVPIPDADIRDEIAETGLSWSDLSLDFLWWPGAEISGRERIRTRSAYVVDLPAPPHSADRGGVRLWIDAAAMLVVRAERLGPDQQRLKRIDVDSILEIEPDVWMVKDLLIRDFANNRRMGVRFEEAQTLTAPESN